MRRYIVKCKNLKIREQSSDSECEINTVLTEENVTDLDSKFNKLEDFGRKTPSLSHHTEIKIANLIEQIRILGLAN